MSNGAIAPNHQRPFGNRREGKDYGAMVPLIVAIGLDFHLIARVILCVFAGLWFVLPRMASRKRGEH